MSGIKIVITSVVSMVIQFGLRHRLETRGIYGAIRNPSYLRMLISRWHGC
jgi:protein-S-isoprenylcysteine O-methyltransferase Ste14